MALSARLRAPLVCGEGERGPKSERPAVAWADGTPGRLPSLRSPVVAALERRLGSATMPLRAAPGRCISRLEGGHRASAGEMVPLCRCAARHFRLQSRDTCQTSSAAGGERCISHRRAQMGSWAIVPARARSDKRSALYMCMEYVWTYLPPYTTLHAALDAQETKPGSRRGSRALVSAPAAGPPRMVLRASVVVAKGRPKSHPRFPTTHHPCPVTHLQSGLRCMEGFLGKRFQGFATGLVLGWGGRGGRVSGTQRSMPDVQLWTRSPTLPRSR